MNVLVQTKDILNNPIIFVSKSIQVYEILLTQLQSNNL